MKKTTRKAYVAPQIEVVKTWPFSMLDATFDGGHGSGTTHDSGGGGGHSDLDDGDDVLEGKGVSFGDEWDLWR